MMSLAGALALRPKGAVQKVPTKPMRGRGGDVAVSGVAVPVASANAFERSEDVLGAIASAAKIPVLKKMISWAVPQLQGTAWVWVYR